MPDRSVSVGHLRKFPVSHVCRVWNMTSCLFVRAFVRPVFCSGDFYGNPIREFQWLDNEVYRSFGRSVCRSAFSQSVVYSVLYRGHLIGSFCLSIGWSFGQSASQSTIRPVVGHSVIRLIILPFGKALVIWSVVGHLVSRWSFGQSTYQSTIRSVVGHLVIGLIIPSFGQALVIRSGVAHSVRRWSFGHLIRRWSFGHSVNHSTIRSVVGNSVT